MIHRNIKNEDPLQLQQMIIYLKSELAKYKYEANLYKERIHYTFIENLEHENAQLVDEKNTLTEELQTVKEELLKTRMQMKENKTKELQLMERFDCLFTEKIEATTKAVKNQIQKTLNEERIEFEKNMTKLLSKITLLEKKKIQVKDVPKSGTMHDETFTQLDEQINQIIVQSLEYEKNLNQKFKLLDTMEGKLKKLEIDIENVKVFGVEGRVVKECLNPRVPLQVYSSPHMIEREES